MRKYPPERKSQHDHQRVWLETSTGDDGVWKKQIICRRKDRTFERNQFTYQHKKKDPTDKPEQRRIDARQPDLLTCESISERDQALEHHRFHICLEFCLADCSFQLPGRHAVWLCFIIQTARFDGREQLTCGMKIEWQIREVIKADRECNCKQQNKHNTTLKLRSKKSFLGHGRVYFIRLEFFTLCLKIRAAGVAK